MSISSLFHAIGSRYNRKICKNEFERQHFKFVNERPIEYGFIFQCLLKTMPVSVLDVGTGRTALPDVIRHCGFHVTAIDNTKDYWANKITNRHFYVIDDDILKPKLTKTFDFITCTSVLEHIRDHGTAVRNLFCLLRDGGHLVLTFPYNENRYIPDVYVLDGSESKNPNTICQMYSREQLDEWISTNNARILMQDYWEIFEGDVWGQGKRLSPPSQVNNGQKHHHTCILLQKQ